MSPTRQRRPGLLATLPVLAALSGAASAQTVTRVEWIGASAPSTPEQLSRMHTDARVRVTWADGSTSERALGYRLLMSTLSRIGDNTNPAGTLYDADLHPIPDPTVTGAVLVAETPDGSMLTRIGDRLFHLANYEYDWLLADGSAAWRYAGWQFRHADGSRDSRAANLPSSVTLTEVSQDPASGRLTPIAQSPVDFSGVGGLAVACNAYETPWGSFLTSEENYSVDARQVEADRQADPSGRRDSLAGITFQYYNGRRLANPYRRGFLTEVSIGADASTRVAKHFAIGRGSYEMGLVMPDQRTVFAAHDGTNKPITLFVADRAGELGSGTLYAARLDQQSAANGGRFGVEWIRLGHASDTELAALIDAGIRFSDIFDSATTRTPGYREIYVGSDTTPEYLKVKQAVAAAFLETLRYAALRGASTEFRKAEGLAFDPDGRVAYLAISDIGKGMRAGRTSGDAGDQIRVSPVRAGGVYAFAVDGGQRDTDGRVIESDFVPISAHVPAGLLGVDLGAADAMNNRADPERIANPDNLAWSSAYRTLFIGEDSGLHSANVLWAWQPGMSAPVRLLSAPVGAELTGLRVYSDIGGHAYILTNAQHLGDFDPRGNATLRAALARVRAEWSNGHAAPLGYLTGLPVVPAR